MITVFSPLWNVFKVVDLQFFFTPRRHISLTSNRSICFLFIFFSQTSATTQRRSNFDICDISFNASLNIGATLCYLLSVIPVSFLSHVSFYISSRNCRAVQRSLTLIRTVNHSVGLMLLAVPRKARAFEKNFTCARIAKNNSFSDNNRLGLCRVFFFFSLVEYHVF